MSSVASLRLWTSVSQSRSAALLDTPVWNIVSNGVKLSKPFFTSARCYDDPSTRPLRQRYPTRPLNTSIFESFNSEYLPSPSLSERSGTGAQEASTSTSYAPIVASDLLVGAVEKGEYEHAHVLRRELVDAGEDIRPNIIYLDMILHILRSPSPSSSTADADANANATALAERYATFLDWWSLIPTKATVDLASSYPLLKTKMHIIKDLLTASMDNLTPLSEMAIIGSSKGYASFFAKDVLRTVVSLTSPRFSGVFYERFEGAAMGYAGGVEGLEEQRSVWRSRVVAAYAMSGRLDEATSALNAAHLSSIHIKEYAYTILMRHLHSSGNDIKVVKDLYFQQYGRLFAPPVAPKVSRRREKELKQPVTISSLAHALRTLRHSILLPGNEAPSATYISQITHACLVHGRTSALKRLRRKALRSSKKSAQLWIMAEMSYYRSREEWMGIVWVFWRYFWMVGVERGLVDLVLGPARGASASAIADAQGKPTNRKRKFNKAGWEPISGHGEEWVMNGRLVPSSHVTAMVWEALLELRITVDGLRLYSVWRKFKAEARRQYSSSSPPSDGTIVTSPAARFDASHFTHFVRTFGSMSVRSPDKALEVVREMREIGVKENVYTWNTLVRIYMRAGQEEKAVEIVKEMMSSGWIGDDSVSIGGVPKANIVTLTGLMRELARKGWNSKALEVHELLLELGYVRGENGQTDILVDRLTENIR